MLPRELNFKICASKMPFPAFWDHCQWKIVEFLTGSGSWGLLLPITSVHYRHYRAQSYRRLMLGSQKGKNGWETTEKRQTIVLKRLVKQRKHYLSLARKSFINRENIKRKREARNIRREREVSGQNGLESLFILALAVQITRRVFLGLYDVNWWLIWREAIS